MSLVFPELIPFSDFGGDFTSYFEAVVIVFFDFLKRF
jgi:hypothetical protein